MSLATTNNAVANLTVRRGSPCLDRGNSNLSALLPKPHLRLAVLLSAPSFGMQIVDRPKRDDCSILKRVALVYASSRNRPGNRPDHTLHPSPNSALSLRICTARNRELVVHSRERMEIKETANRDTMTDGCQRQDLFCTIHTTLAGAYFVRFLHESWRWVALQYIPGPLHMPVSCCDPDRLSCGCDAPPFSFDQSCQRCTNFSMTGMFTMKGPINMPVHVASTAV